ncbi:Abhydrolase 1 domain containing protein, partial [Asbolus verrucosus]
YDVWLGNSRGTLYSKRHVSLKHTDETFWNFRFVLIHYFLTIFSKNTNSFHEMGYYDNYATIRYIKTKTQVSKIIFLGFSMGGSLGLVYTCLRPYEAAQSIEVMINLATPAFNYVNLMLTQLGSEVSHKTFYHYIQVHRSGGNFQMYNYGKEENLKMYGKGEPPLYPLSKIKVPVLLVYSENDSLVYPKYENLKFQKNLQNFTCRNVIISYRFKTRGVILLQHPYANDARIWVAQYNQSIAFVFWEAGYDVWLGNSRGTLYSQRHISLKPSDETFWNFSKNTISFHEMGYYDNYATIGYIKTKTQVSKIIYLGFSMGGTLGLIYACLRPHEAAQSIEVMINLATPNYVNLMLTQVGSEMSHKTVYHYIQMHRSGGNFRMYDYGKEVNLKLYGRGEPPLYPLIKIEIPVLFVYSENDSLISL